MASNDDPTSNSRAVGFVSTPSEKLEASGAELTAQALTGGKRKAKDTAPEPAAVGGEPKPTAAAPASDAFPGDEDEEEEWVEMPEDYLRWVLAQTRETDPVPRLGDYDVVRRGATGPEELARLSRLVDRFQALQDEFFEFQGWVRETFEKNGCVMVPPYFVGPQDQAREEMSELRDKLMKEYDDAEAESASKGGD